ncbi:hypothetical protein [Virgibacillus necropolis]|uniref:Uncharacterized protein n=1 Tax=Virgibacillus necropolis TaxID=163877 RepID=A0A221MF91_9BACI|nr:hypothetical protein [Virgibacillus necropolis]ASN06333.1 hypothetical protein CFK40_15550 [Virgibacillus necropolis]
MKQLKKKNSNPKKLKTDLKPEGVNTHWTHHWNLFSQGFLEFAKGLRIIVLALGILWACISGIDPSPLLEHLIALI